MLINRAIDYTFKKRPVFRAFFMLKIIFTLGFIAQNISICSQVEYSRIEAEFTIKEISDNQSITVGKIFYDINIGVIYFQVHYPRKEILVYTDSLLYKIIDDRIVEKKTTSNYLKHNLFNMVLDNKMEYYGMKESPYSLVNTILENDQIITTWEPPKSKKNSRGLIKLSQKNKLVYGLISYDIKGDVLSKQFFEDYLNIGGLMMPQKLTQIGYFESPTIYKITTYRNFKLNNFDDEKNYSYNFSAIKP